MKITCKSTKSRGSTLLLAILHSVSMYPPLLALQSCIAPKPIISQQ